MYALYGSQILTAALAPITPHSQQNTGLLGRLVDLAPATLPLGIYAAVRTIRLGLTDESDDRQVIGGVFWLLWLAVAALVPTVLPSGPRPALGLFLLAPLSLLAARAITDLASRLIPIRTLNWLALATAVSIAWWASANLRGRSTTSPTPGPTPPPPWACTWPSTSWSWPS